MDAPAAGSEPSSRTFFWAAAVCLGVAVVSRLCFLGEPFKNDAGIYICFGKVICQGGDLYHDFWDTKLPSVALLMAPLYAVFGSRWWPYVLVQMGMGIASAWLLARAVGWYAASWAYRPALLFGLVGLNLSLLTMTGFQLETVQVFLESVAACVILRSLVRPGLVQVFVAGLLVGIAAMPKPTGLAVGGAAVVAYLVQAISSGKTAGSIGVFLRRLVLLGLGIAILAAAVVAWVFAQPWRVEMPEVLHEIKLYGSGNPWQRVLQLRTWAFFALPFVPMVIRWFVAVVERKYDPKLTPADPGSSAAATPVSPAITAFAWAWSAAEVLGVIAQRRMYGYHYLVIWPAAVLLFAVSRRTSIRPVLIAVTPIAIVSLAFAVRPALMLRQPHPMLISSYVRDHTAPGDSVWGDPEAQLLLETGRLPGSRLQMTFYLVNHDQAPAEFTDILLSDFEQRKPKYLVLPQNWSTEVRTVAHDPASLQWFPRRSRDYLTACDRIEQYIRQHYVLEKTLNGKTAWRRAAS
jgi:hypothetical protein